MLVSERLAATQVAHDSEQFECGKKAGSVCAKQTATAPQLKRLAKLHADLSSGNQNPEWDDHFIEDSGIHFMGGQGLAGWIAMTLKPGSSADEFWGADVLGDEWLPQTEEPMFLKGFCEGAFGVWSEV